MHTMIYRVNQNNSRKAFLFIDRIIPEAHKGSVNKGDEPMTTSLDNVSNEQLADDYGKLDTQIKTLQKRADAIKVELKARKIETVEGAAFTVSLSASERVSYDDKAIREILGADTCEPFKRVTITETLRVKPTAIFDQSGVEA